MKSSFTATEAGVNLLFGTAKVIDVGFKLPNPKLRVEYINADLVQKGNTSQIVYSLHPHSRSLPSYTIILNFSFDGKDPKSKAKPYGNDSSRSSSSLKDSHEEEKEKKNDSEMKDKEPEEKKKESEMKQEKEPEPEKKKKKEKEVKKEDKYASNFRKFLRSQDDFNFKLNCKIKDENDKILDSINKLEELLSKYRENNVKSQLYEPILKQITELRMKIQKELPIRHGYPGPPDDNNPILVKDTDKEVIIYEKPDENMYISDDMISYTHVPILSNPTKWIPSSISFLEECSRAPKSRPASEK